MKYRTVKKRIRRHVTWFAKHKIPLAFKDSADMHGWINDICKYHNEKRRRRNT